MHFLFCRVKPFQQEVPLLSVSAVVMTTWLPWRWVAAITAADLMTLNTFLGCASAKTDLSSLYQLNTYIHDFYLFSRITHKTWFWNKFSSIIGAFTWVKVAPSSIWSTERKSTGFLMILKKYKMHIIMLVQEPQHYYSTSTDWTKKSQIDQ